MCRCESLADTIDRIPFLRASCTSMAQPLSQLASSGEFDQWAWQNTLDDGTAYSCNHWSQFSRNDAVSDTIAMLPFGQGASVFDIGRHTAFVDFLLDHENNGAGTKKRINAVASLLASSLPADCTRSTKIQLCTQDNDSKSSLDSGPRNSNIVLVVWGHDGESTAQLQQSIADKRKLATARGETYSMADIMREKGPLFCNEQSRVYRRHIANTTMKNLVDSFAVGQGGVAPSADTCGVWHFEHVHLEAEGDDVVCMCDCNCGIDGIVFHSLNRGSTMFMNQEGSNRVVLPASDGRNTSACDDNAHTFRETRHGTANAAVAVQKRDHANSFFSVDAAESSYATRRITDYASHTHDCKIYQLRAIATALPAVQRQNGKINGNHDCNTIESMLACLSPECETVIVQNSAAWRQELTDADPHQRPYTYMNQDTAVLDEDGSITHFIIDRPSFTE